MIMEKFTVKEMAPTRWIYDCNEKNAKERKVYL